MKSFLEEVLEEIKQQYNSIEDVVFVLPSKRAGTFLKKSIAKTTQKTQFLPDIYSIETFVEKIANLSYASNTQQLFELYNAYLKINKEEKDGFYAFSKWGQTLLQDFNEIDRYLIDPDKILQELNHWALQKEKSKMIEDYIFFWNNLKQLYSTFNQNLLNKAIGHQGLVYEQACKKLEQYIDVNTNKKHVFIGFNALNKAESTIVQRIIENPSNAIYWDNDPYFVNDYIHDAGYFMRQHKNTWDYYKKNTLKGLKRNYLSKKNINIIGVPKNIAQAKYVGNLLAELKSNSPQSLKNTAVVLGDENLLNPILNAIPKQINRVNITMGYSLYKTPLASLFSDFFNLYLKEESQGWFYKNVLSFLSHPYLHILLSSEENNNAATLINKIKDKNWIYLNLKKIEKALDSKEENIALLFFNETINPTFFIEKCIAITLALKEKFSRDESSLELEYLYRFYTLFNQLKELINEYSFINDIKALYSLYKELLSSETLDFQGEALEGLQVMGMLESRNLDFETVIITSVNEGILPSGKSNNSFIPYDVKQDFGLPTYKDKDAIYTYHFYRLMQRAKNIYILYNTEPDVLEGGEKSRLISQMLTDKNKRNDITEIIASPNVTPIIKEELEVSKNEDLMKHMVLYAQKGFSPTSLTNYIRNPIDFYKKNILKINDALEVEETVAANTFGTIVHDSLEELYTPFIGSFLTKEKLTDLQLKIKPTVSKHFIKSYGEGDISRGKNFIAFHVVVKYIENFIKLELKEIEKHQVKILGLEDNLEIALDIPEIPFPVKLKGKLDRIDEKDGMIRIIDYKTGKVATKDVEIVVWEDIISSYDYSKAFQLLCYATMYNYKQPINIIEAGILSFKNLNAGILNFATKEKKGSRTKNITINQEILDLFSNELKKLIIEICNPNIPFVEKPI